MKYPDVKSLIVNAIYKTLESQTLKVIWHDPYEQN